LQSLLLHLLLPLLQFLQELLGRFYGLLSVLLLVVGCGRLVIRLVSLIVGLRLISRCISSVFRRVLWGVLTFNDDGISSRGRRHRRSHRLCWAIIESIRLLVRRRIALDRAA
jgi:hypothetical protein